MDKKSVSRRAFLRKAAAGAGASAAVAATASLAAEGQANRTSAARQPGANPITTPPEFAAAAAAPASESTFPMTGAQVFARACVEEGVAALFCCPGNYTVTHAIAAAGIPSYGGRHEGAMAHAADAFTRITGEITVCSGTEGPGFTDMICAIAAANAARTPMLVVASNMSISQEDTEAGIQLGYQQPTTEGMKKYGKRLINPRRVHEYAGYAFRQLRSGVPKPVHLDFPSEVASARFKEASEVEFYHDKTRYRTDSRPHPAPAGLKKAVDLIRTAQRPILVSSNGVFYARAWEALKRLAEKGQIPVVESGAMKGQFPDDSPLSANAAPSALASADLVILVGQHCMPTVGEFAFGPEAKYIRIDQSAEDIGRNIPIDLGLVSCERAALEALADAVPQPDARRLDRRSGRRSAEVRGPEHRVLQDRARLQGRRPPGGDRPGTRRLPVPRQAPEGADDGGLGRVRHRPLRAPRAAGFPARPDHERRLPVRGHRS